VPKEDGLRSFLKQDSSIRTYPTARHYVGSAVRRIAKLGESAGLLTGYYEPIVDGSRFPTPIFKVPIYRRPPDLVPPVNSTSLGFPNEGQSLRRTGNGELIPYYDRGEILDGALDGQHLEICWIKDQADALMIQIEGSARVRLEDGTMLRINYDAHNGYPFVPVSRILIEQNIVPRHKMSLERICEWIRANPDDAEKVWRQNRSFVFFRIVGLSDDREAVGAEGIPLTPGRSIAIDGLLHIYGTPFFLQAGRPLTTGNQYIRFDRLMIAQDTGSAIVGPARADIFWGAGEQAGRLARGLHHLATFAMLVPREVDPVAAGARMPLPPEKPPLTGEANAKTSLPKPATLVQGHRVQADDQQSGCSGTGDRGRTSPFGRTEPNRHARTTSPVTAGADCGPGVKAAHAKEVAKRVVSIFPPKPNRKVRSRSAHDTDDSPGSVSAGL
jgi:membrane-bound lytic murein transglycosylase A